MFELFKKVLAEDNGNPSTMRYLTFFIIVVILVNWTYVNIKTGNLSGFNWEEIAVMLGPLFAKAYQKDKEEKVVRTNEVK